MTGKPFEPGNPGGPGRRRGSRNKLAEAFLEALYADFQVNGVAALDAARVESPLGYCRMIAGLLPQKVEIERVASTMSDDELLEIMRAGVVRDQDRMDELVVRPPGEEVH